MPEGNASTHCIGSWFDVIACLDEVALKQNIAAVGTQTPFVLPIPSPLQGTCFIARFSIPT
jgi:hypothetical protein